MYRLYVGNLKPNCPEESLRSLFEEHGVEIGHILVKRSYAFVDCADQTNADRAVEILNGNNFAHYINNTFLAVASEYLH